MYLLLHHRWLSKSGVKCSWSHCISSILFTAVHIWLPSPFSEKSHRKSTSSLTTGETSECHRFLFGWDLSDTGALANLAAFDCQREFEDILRVDQITCTTFGAPRPGNHSFAEEYNKRVPSTWGVINARSASKAVQHIADSKIKRPTALCRLILQPIEGDNLELCILKGYIVWMQETSSYSETLKPLTRSCPYTLAGAKSYYKFTRIDASHYCVYLFQNNNYLADLIAHCCPLGDLQLGRGGGGLVFVTEQLVQSFWRWCWTPSSYWWHAEGAAHFKHFNYWGLPDLVFECP